MIQKLTWFAVSMALTAPTLAAPTQTTPKKSTSKPSAKTLPTKQLPTKSSTPKPVLLSKTLTPDGKTPVANIKNTPIPDVAPVNNGYHVIINIPQQRLFLYHDGVLEKVYRVAVGKAITQTNLGEHKIGGKAFDPTWHIPKSIQAELKNGKTTVPPGPNNPLGPVFVRLGNPKLGLGIHGTNNPKSVPGVVSHGCVRMVSEQALDFAHTITTGSPATVSYEMATLNVDEANHLWLTTFGDPYKKNNLNKTALKNTIQAWAKNNGSTISNATVDRIIKGKPTGKPICLSCKGKSPLTAKGQFQSLAWNSSSTKFTAPKSTTRSNSSSEIPPENNEIEVDALDDEIKPVTSKTKAVSESTVKKATVKTNTSVTSERGERPLKPISATSAFEQPLKPINVKPKSASAVE